ncbi:hypothetical protein JR316_0006348 [Psilocybe cubensis]|uniref:Uncharacterized protein n=1 Tax=Psilocybe cubensis TaxID=181762 RepID=A0ACB8H1R8_PSICU|nr:hypothetical protein JR316_0006348 [Psilocybe cubensis]KAH9481821.1 hypothetical protein JR316_0006348 [Psilocybe cubensis]
MYGQRQPEWQGLLQDSGSKPIASQPSLEEYSSLCRRFVTPANDGSQSLPSSRSETSDTYFFPADMDIMANRIDDSSFDSLALSDTDSCASQLPTPVDDDFFTPKDSVESLAVQGWTDDFDDGDSFLISGVVWDQASGQHLLTAPRQVSRKSFYDYYYPPLQPNHWQEYYREQERLNVKSDNRFSGKASVAAPSDSEPGPIPRVDLSAAYISSDGVEQSNEVEDLNPDPECVYTFGPLYGKARDRAYVFVFFSATKNTARAQDISTVRNEKIRRVEDYIVYQSELNNWKYKCKDLQTKIDQLEQIYQGTSRIMNQHHKFQKEEYKRLQQKIEVLEDDLDDEEEETMLVIELLISIFEKVIQAFYQFKPSVNIG